MTALAPRGVYTLEVLPGEIIQHAHRHVPNVPFRLTMAAIDPSDPNPVFMNGNTASRSTLKLLRREFDEVRDMELDFSSGDDEDEDDSDISDDSDLELNGGPSDPEKVYGARAAARLAQLKQSEESDDDSDVEMSGVNGLNGSLTRQEKGKAMASLVDEDDDISSSDGPEELEKAILCTLDVEKNYQQPLDITISAHDQVFFQVTGSHPVYLTGNYLDPTFSDSSDSDSDFDSDEEETDYFANHLGLAPYDEDELSGSEESDGLDDLDDPRIEELDEDDGEDVPKLVQAEKKSKVAEKGKNKRPATDDEEDSEDGGNPNELTLDDLVAKSLKPAAEAAEKPLSKKQRKKLKNNAAQAVPASNQTEDTLDKGVSKKSESPAPGKAEKNDKKVQFAAKLEQGPTKSTKDSKKQDAAEKSAIKADSKKESTTETNGDAKGAEKKDKAIGNVSVVKGVKIEDKKLGNGKKVKSGDRVSMRYIGKLAKNGSRFDANTKGKPFVCAIGKGEVIKGWDIGLVGMSPGGERKLTVPANLAYGNKSLPGIPANSELVFELKLLSIN